MRPDSPRDFGSERTQSFMPERLKTDQARFPLLDRDARLAGWSDDAPNFRETTLRHPEAEAKIGTPIVIVPALLMSEQHMRMAGGVPNEEGMWVLAIAQANCIRHMPIVIHADKPAEPAAA
jgi:hypothetical protein